MVIENLKYSNIKINTKSCILNVYRGQKQGALGDLQLAKNKNNLAVNKS